jgi:hypothetical protein
MNTVGKPNNSENLISRAGERAKSYSDTSGRLKM